MTTYGKRRYQVRADAFYVRNADGVWLRNNRGSFSIRGASAYQLVASLFANLDGERTVEEFCVGLPENARQSVYRLVGTLEQSGFLREVTRPAEAVPEWMRERYSAHLAFLDHHGERPVAAMMSVRAQTVAVIGEGVALRALLGALADFGLAKVLIVTSDRGRAATAELVSAAHRDDPGLRWRTFVAGEELDLGRVAQLPEFDDLSTVLIAVDGPLAPEDEVADHEALAVLQARLRQRGSGVGLLARCGDFVVSSAPDAEDDSCWECVRRSFVMPVQGSASDLPPALAPATIGALHLAQHTFVRLAGLDITVTEPVTSVEPLVPAVRTHARHRHPSCPRHPAITPARIDPAALAGEALRPDVPAPEDPPQIVAIADRIVAATSAWTDQITGPLLSVGEEAGEQLPLSVSYCRVADPQADVLAPVVELVACHALSPREARNQAVLFALEYLASRCADAVFGVGWSPAEAWYRAQAAAALAAPAGSASGWLPARRGTGEVRDFLADTLAGEGRAWFAYGIEYLPSGFVRARVRTENGETTAAVGTDVDHAIDNALLRAVSAGSPEAGSVHVAQLAPPTGDWAAAAALISKGGSPGEAVDVSALLPFLGRDAYLVAVGWPE